MPIVRRAALPVALSLFLALIAVACVAAMPGAHAWAAKGPGGISVYNPEPEAATPPVAEPTIPTPGDKAIIVRGRAIAPADAPAAVKKVIAAANKIRAKPYIWGGGHGRWWDRGYDCSGSVSYALHGGGLLETPMVSGSLARWGKAGAGRWITIYANATHVYAVIAGLRWDTAGDTSGTGPRWHESPLAAASGRFMTRHPEGY